MRSSEIVSKITELKDQYGHTDFPFESYVELESKLRQMKHMHCIVEKINKKDLDELKSLDPGSLAYQRRERLMAEDQVRQNSRMVQIQEMKQELQALTDKLNQIIRG